MMACNYQVWIKVPDIDGKQYAGISPLFPGWTIGSCGAASDSSGLCPEHAAFVADAKCLEVSKLDMKHWYRVPARRKAKLAPPNVRETIIEPGHYAKQYALYEAAEGKDTYGVWFGKAILPVRAEPSAEDIAEQERQRIEAHAQLMAEQAAFLERRAEAERKEAAKRAAAAISNAKREAEDAARAAAFPNVPAVQPGFKVDTVDHTLAEAIAAQPQPNVKARPAAEAIAEPDAETVCGFRFEYRAEGGSGFYWNGKRVASTRQGLERMGPAILARVCK
jgi:hypothetical protein